MPAGVQTIMLGAPTTHFVRISQAILFRGAGIETVWPHFLAITAIGALLFTASLSIFRRSLVKL